MTRFRLSLFQHIYLRVIAIIAASLVGMMAYTYFHQYSAMVNLWQQDLQQEADWLAAHSRATASSEQIADAWRNMHDGVRLQIYDADGALLADSFSGIHGRALDESLTISARSERILDPAGGSLVLSRLRPGAFSGQSGLVVTTLILFLLAGALLWPLTRHVTSIFVRLSTLASRVAEGQFGATIPEQGDKDLRALIASFNAMSRRLKDAEIRNHKLLVDVSHEFRSPLGRMTALLDTLQRHPEESEELMGRLRGELSLLDRLTGDALNDARFKPETSALELEAVHLGSWAQSAFERLMAGGGDFAGRFNITNSAGDCRVKIDTQRIMQVLGNLVDNARRALDDRPAGVIDLEASVDETNAMLRITDNGRGIDIDDMPFVFDRFFQAGSQNEGSGLGLSIARELTQAHGGDLVLEARPGGGVVAEIRLPIHPLGAN
ncbi:MAG: HAMP domain-containing sensor histidine kinase [Maricaulis sp.]|nr:HAMP domain-containing sensor histidine kinase [Maricaulis sp.]